MSGTGMGDLNHVWHNCKPGDGTGGYYRNERQPIMLPQSEFGRRGIGEGVTTVGITVFLPIMVILFMMMMIIFLSKCNEETVKTNMSYEKENGVFRNDWQNHKGCLYVT
jgi:hypothetical protein